MNGQIAYMAFAQILIEITHCTNDCVFSLGVVLEFSENSAILILLTEFCEFSQLWSIQQIIINQTINLR